MSASSNSLPMIYFIEGNVGSGKSTFLKNIQDLDFMGFSDAQFLQEPVDQWKNTKDSNGINVLEHFYNDMQKFCYSFQSFAFITRIMQLDSIDSQKTHVFIERSVFCDRNVFASAAKDSGILSEIDWIIYNTWFTTMTEKYSSIFDNARYIYLKCSPQTSMERIVQRSRSEENTISIEYLTALHQKHEEWLVNDTYITNTIIIDAEKNLTDLDELALAVKQIPFN